MKNFHSIFLLIVLGMFISCKENSTKEESQTKSLFEKDWDNFRNTIIQKKEFDWNSFVEIEGQLGEDYAYLFENEEAIEHLKKTTYSDLYDAMLLNEPIKQLTIGKLEEFTRPEGHTFYFKETDKGLKFIGFEPL
ncbi:hypothetical protein M0M57_04770 [Flavobacterium azooxidireducens]|uniref:Uncharacterized protein n=1 Tax=Flavobacterium azooxidireducens TaxID=1871076 RepID=A0ABY4KH67_9FLAO|nr:hypothetical protein [Flavobacterium azooxidireducens]UPQ80148.1 hypothetical protein M0M57_04770 [Flavobacterium azooxidireducens]